MDRAFQISGGQPRIDAVQIAQARYHPEQDDFWVVSAGKWGPHAFLSAWQNEHEFGHRRLSVKFRQ